MHKIIATLAALVAFIALTASPTQAAGTPEPPVGKWETPHVVVYIGPGLEGWRVPKAIRDWRGFGIVSITVSPTPCGECISIVKHKPYMVERVLDRWAGLAYLYGPEQQEPVARCEIHLNAKIAKPSPGIVSHEFGHCLGLGHSHTKDSVMGTLYRDPSPQLYDFVSLARLYYPDSV